MESFFAWLKRERVTRSRYLTRKPARTDIFDDIERFYNRQRPHHFTGGLSPLEFESRALNSTVHFLGAIPPEGKSRDRARLAEAAGKNEIYLGPIAGILYEENTVTPVGSFALLRAIPPISQP